MLRTIMLSVVALIFIMCTSFKDDELILQELRYKTLLYATHSIDMLSKSGYTVTEFYDTKQEGVYCYFTNYQTDIRVPMLHPRAKKSNSWKELSDSIVYSLPKYDITIVGDSTRKELSQRMYNLNIFIQKPLITDSCIYVSARFSLSADEFVFNWPVYELLIYKFSLEGKIESYFYYLAIE